MMTIHTILTLARSRSLFRGRALARLLRCQIQMLGEQRQEGAWLRGVWERCGCGPAAITDGGDEVAHVGVHDVA